MYRSFLVADNRLRASMLEEGRAVHTDTWQGRDVTHDPSAEMRELLNVTMALDLRGINSLDHWRAEVRPNVPWADDHFLERVSGQPLNPPPSWAWWPWAHSANKFRADAKFNHTYPERFWPKHAGCAECDGRGTFLDAPNHVLDGRTYVTLCDGRAHRGIRFAYGDLADVIALLRKDPLTRQAYLPIFFPEDTGIGDGGRKPCTLGYQFIRREGALHCFYPMRSCDLVRHFRDDVYLAIRLMLWVLEQLANGAVGSESQRPWLKVVPGQLHMHMTSLHCFVNDLPVLREELGR